MNTPSLDKEIAKNFKTKKKAKRKKREHIWTRQKTSKYRSQSAIERRSSQSRAESVSRSQSTYDRPFSTMTFRPDSSLSREFIIDHSINNMFNCIDGCTEIFYDLNALTRHKMLYHKLLAKFWCYECPREKFTSE